MSKRKPHNDFAGYVAELRNKYSDGHTVISDCKRAAKEGTPYKQMEAVSAIRSPSDTGVRGN
jgi:hypothetical protein